MPLLPDLNFHDPSLFVYLLHRYTRLTPTASGNGRGRECSERVHPHTLGRGYCGDCETTTFFPVGRNPTKVGPPKIGTVHRLRVERE